MTVISIHLAQVLHTFNSAGTGELTVNSGEVLKIIEKGKGDWLKCRHVITGEEGVVPFSYVKKLTFKIRLGEQCMFLAIADFSSGVEGDLEFRTGDLIIGEKAVNDDWWEGRLALQPSTAGNKMFPLTFVVEVHGAEVNKQQTNKSRTFEPFIGRAISYFEARYDDEVSLQVNDQVHVLRDVDSDWYSGFRVTDYRNGIFPKSFVEFVSLLKVPLSRTSRAMHKDIFDSDSSGTLSPDTSMTQQPREHYQNVPIIPEEPPTQNLPSVFDVPKKVQPAQPPHVADSPAAYINFDEIFKEVQQQNLTNNQSRNYSPMSAHQIQYSNDSFGYDKYTSKELSQSEIKPKQIYAQGPVFDTKTLNQLNTSFSLDDVVRYEMQRAVVTKAESPPSRPPPPATRLSSRMSSKPSYETFDFSEFEATPNGKSATSNKYGSFARPRPSGSSPTPNQLPLIPSTSSRAVSMNFAESSPLSNSNSQVATVKPPVREKPFVSNNSDKIGTQRSKVINELISTEQNYLYDLELCCRVVKEIHCPAIGAGFACQLSSGMNHPLLGNMDEVASLNRRLLELLQAEVSKSQDRQLIGSCFVQLANDLENVYSCYCQHQPGAAAFLNRLNQVDETRAYTEKVAETMKAERASAFSLESVLLKPVQRILKYPLLLSELIKHTEPDHPDIESLASASVTLSKLTSRLNERRRRLDLVLKYRKSPSLTTKLSKAFNVHTISKKTGRISQRISDTISFSANQNNDVFNRYEQEFQQADRLFKQIVRVFQRWSEAYCEFAQAQRNLANAVGELTAGDPICPQFVVFREQWNRAYDTVYTTTRVGKINALTTDPIRQIAELFGGPSNVLKKRQDKLLDFRRLSGPSDMNNEDLEVARTDFVALNAQLTDELPTLCRFSYRILLLGYVSFLRHYSLLSRSSANALASSNSNVALASTALSANMQRMANFNFIKSSGRAPTFKFENTAGSEQLSTSQNLTDTMLTSSTLEAPPISVANSSALQKKYNVSELYITTEPTVSRQSLELGLSSGTLVGIVKRHDPTGQSDRWFVDTGSGKGFVPKRSLRPYTPSPSVDMMLLDL